MGVDARSGQEAFDRPFQSNRIDQTRPKQRIATQKFADVDIETAGTHPRSQRNPETLLGPIDQVPWHQVIENTAQQVFRAQLSYPESKGTGKSELGQPVIEQGLSAFEPHPHGHSIDFDKNVTGKIVMKIPTHHGFFERRGGGTQARS